jgi:four helix bundle protein
MKTNDESKWDLEDRLLDYACAIIRLVESLPNTRTANHLAGQLMRSGTSPLPNHGESQAAESVDDFIHKISVVLKELRESERWLKLLARLKYGEDHALVFLVGETDELIRIFRASLNTARERKLRQAKTKG